MLSPALQRRYNCAELHRISQQLPLLSPALRLQSSTSGADQTRYSSLPSVLSCGASSTLAQPSYGFGRSHRHEVFLLTPTCKADVLRAEVAARQCSQKALFFFFKAFFPPTLLHYSLILILCHCKSQQVCAAHIN